MNLLHDLNHLDVWVRAVRVFLYAFLAQWALTGNAVNKESATAALAAGFSAVFNYGKQFVH